MANEFANNAEAWIAIYGKKNNRNLKSSNSTPYPTFTPIFYAPESGQTDQRTSQSVMRGSNQNNSARVATPKPTQAPMTKTPITNNVVKKLDFNTPYRPQQFNNIDATDLDLSENYVMVDEEPASDQENEPQEE